MPGSWPSVKNIVFSEGDKPKMAFYFRFQKAKVGIQLE
jgi:hypothetical protein